MRRCLISNLKSSGDFRICPSLVFFVIWLIGVAAWLKSCVREMDTVARFGGDEFVVMISELARDKVASTAEAAPIAEKIRRRLGEPYRLSVNRRG